MTAASDNIACQEDPHDRDAERFLAEAHDRRRVRAGDEGAPAAALPGHEPMTRMRAVICRAFGDVEGLKVEEVTAPTPKPGEVLIVVKATAVNYADALMTAGRCGWRRAHRGRDRQRHGRAGDRGRQHAGEARGGPRARRGRARQLRDREPDRAGDGADR